MTAKQQVLAWLREQREIDGSGRCYGIKELAEVIGCSQTDLLDDANDSGVLRELKEDGLVGITSERDCVFANGGRMDWDW